MAKECPDYRDHGNMSGKYEQRVNGVWLTRDCNLAVAGLIWNQTACRCVWGPEGDIGLLDFERESMPPGCPFSSSRCLLCWCR